MKLTKKTLLDSVKKGSLFPSFLFFIFLQTLDIVNNKIIQADG